MNREQQEAVLHDLRLDIAQRKEEVIRQTTDLRRLADLEAWMTNKLRTVDGADTSTASVLSAAALRTTGDSPRLASVTQADAAAAVLAERGPAKTAEIAEEMIRRGYDVRGETHEMKVKRLTDSIYSTMRKTPLRFVLVSPGRWQLLPQKPVAAEN